LAAARAAATKKAENKMDPKIAAQLSLTRVCCVIIDISIAVSLVSNGDFDTCA
jgi:hypothetical protein